MKIAGFYPRRMAFIIVGMIFALVPFHPFVSCHASGVIGGSAMILCVLVLVLGFMTPKGQGKLFPFVLAFFGVLLHGLCTH